MCFSFPFFIHPELRTKSRLGAIIYKFFINLEVEMEREPNANDFSLCKVQSNIGGCGLNALTRRWTSFFKRRTWARNCHIQILFLFLPIVFAWAGSTISGEPSSGSDGNKRSTSHKMAVTKADPDKDLQAIIDSVSAYTRIIGNPNNRRKTNRIDISKNGISLEQFNLKLADPDNPALVTIHGARDVTLKNCVLEGRRGEEGSQSGWSDATNGITITDAHRVRIVNCRVSNFMLQGITATANPLFGPMESKGGPISHILLAENRLSKIGNGDMLLAGGKGRKAVHGRMIGNVCTSTTQDVLNVIDGFQHARVRNNVVKGSGVGMVVEQHDRGVDRPVKDVIVEENVFKHPSGETDAISFDHQAERYEDITIQNNLVIGGGGKEGLSAGHSKEVYGLTVKNNTFENWGEAISLSGDGKRDVSISGNRIRNVHSGIVTQDFAPQVVVHNHIRRAKVGVHTVAKNRNLRGMVITGNQIHSTNTGIRLAEKGHRISDSIVRNNVLHANDPSKRAQIEANLDGSGNVISDNVVSESPENR